MDVDFINNFYREFAERVSRLRSELGRALSFAEKIIYGHLFSEQPQSKLKHRESYVNLSLIESLCRMRPLKWHYCSSSMPVADK